MRTSLALDGNTKEAGSSRCLLSVQRVYLPNDFLYDQQEHDIEGKKYHIGCESKSSKEELAVTENLFPCWELGWGYLTIVPLNLLKIFFHLFFTCLKGKVIERKREREMEVRDSSRDGERETDSTNIFYPSI